MVGDRSYDQISYPDVEQILERKVGYAMYGPPSTDEGIGYKENEITEIRKMCEIIRQHREKDGNIYFASICVYWSDLDFKEKKVAILFRILKNKKTHEVVFIDDNLRVYKSWKDYMNNNQLPQCHMCFPEDGIYTADENNLVEVDFKKSHACGWGSMIYRLCSGTAIAATLTSVTVATTAVLTPVAAPLLFVATACGVGGAGYTLGDSIAILIDRFTHDQSIKPDNNESFYSWSNIVISPICFATSFMALKNEIPLIGKLFQSASTIDDILDITLDIGSKSIWIITYFATLFKDTGNRKLTAFEMQQIRAFLLYYFHIYVEESISLESLADRLLDIIEPSQYSSPQNGNTFILSLKIAKDSKDIVEQLRNRGFGIGSQKIEA